MIVRAVPPVAWRALELGLSLAPLALAGFAHAASTNLWSEVVAILPAGSRAQAFAWSAWPTAQLAGSLLLLVGAILAKRADAAGRLAVIAALLGLAIAVGLTAWPEIERLAAGRPALPGQLLAGVDARVAAGAVGFFGIAGGVRFARGAGADAPAPARTVERAATDNFGHADWMAIAEARSLFDGGRAQAGGVVIGEAYRVTRTRLRTARSIRAIPQVGGKAGRRRC